MANDTKVAPKAEKSAKAKDTRPIPVFKDKDGALLKLRRKDFPKSKEGRMAFCDYQIARWADRKIRVGKQSDPNAKALKKFESYKKKMVELEAFLKAQGAIK
jgi:hypothetical protein